MISYSITDIGKKRLVNQDYVYASDAPVGNLPNLLVVADGMGGHNAGDLASRYTVESMLDYLKQAKETRPVKLLGGAIHTANETVAQRAAMDPALHGMGTTVVAATVSENCLYVANVGDSRLYLIDSEGIRQITRDHSLVEEMIRMGELKREDARNHPDRNVITRAVGVHVPVRVDFFDVSLEPGDKILLCSDGLTTMLEDKEIRKITEKHEDLKDACEQLVSEANKNGGKDNISVILAEV